MSIGTVASVKTRLGLTGASSDAFIQQLLDEASLLIERSTGLRFDPDPAFVSGADTAPPVVLTFYVPPANTGITQPFNPADSMAQIGTPQQVVHVNVPHARQITAVTVNDDATTVLPIAGAQQGGYWTENDTRLYDPFIRRVGIVQATTVPVYNVKVTGRFGVTPAPADLVGAVERMAARGYQDRNASYADAVQLADGSLANYFRQFQPIVKATIDSYMEVGV